MTTKQVFNPLDPAGQTSVVYGGGSVRRIPLTAARSDAGIGLAASATGGAMGVARTAGTSLQLVGEAASGGAKSDKAFFQVVLPDTYQGSSGGVAGANIPLTVNASIIGSGTDLASGTLLTPVVYTYANGVETAGSVTPASSAISGGAIDYTFVINGGSIVAGAILGIELTVAVSNTSGTATTGTINKVEITA